MRNLTICTLGLMAVLAVLPATAGADPPTREFVPASDFTVSGSCSFDVGVHIVANKEYAITFANGATLVTGALKVTLTNLSSPSKAITLNIPGPGLYTATSDGGVRIDARGPWLFFYPGVLVYTTGHSIFTVSGSGVFSLNQQGGRTTNLCTVLAQELAGGRTPHVSALISIRRRRENELRPRHARLRKQSESHHFAFASSTGWIVRSRFWRVTSLGPGPECRGPVIQPSAYPRVLRP